MSIFHLEPDNFKILDMKDDSMLVHSISGVSIVFFYHIDHGPSMEFLNIYKTLPRKVHGCTFAVANLTSKEYEQMSGYIKTQKNKNIQNKENPYNEIVAKSYETRMPIKSVPLIICYVDGTPYMVFKGKLTLDHLIEFIRLCFSELDRAKKANALMSYGDYKQRAGETDATAYQQCSLPSGGNNVGQCFGLPYIPDDDVMYLEFIHAYKTNK